MPIAVGLIVVAQGAVVVTPSTMKIRIGLGSLARIFCRYAATRFTKLPTMLRTLRSRSAFLRRQTAMALGWFRRWRAGPVGRGCIPFDDWHELIDDYTGIFVVEPIVFFGPIGIAVAPITRIWFRLLRGSTGVDEHGDDDGDFAAPIQVIQHILRAHVAVGADHCLAVIENHQGRRLLRIVLGRHVDPIRVLRETPH